MRPAIFLDRDGVICRNRDDYVKSWEEFVFLPGVKQALRQLAALNWPIVVISNQSAIGRGLVSRRTVELIHYQMKAEIVKAGGRLDAIYYCPHVPEDNCPCRKPNPGMFLSATNIWDIDLARSVFVGDALTDIWAAARAGIQRRYLVLTGRGREALRQARQLSDVPDFVVAADLSAVARRLLSLEPRPAQMPAKGTRPVMR